MKLIFANLGRGTRNEAKRSWASLAEASNEHDVDVTAVVEVDEGDSGYSDRKFAARFFKGWRKRLLKHRTVILVNPKRRTTNTALTPAGRAVKHWSPGRYVAESRILAKIGPAITVIVVHYAAGFRNGARPSWARPLLRLSWLKTLRTHRKRIRNARVRGDHVVTLFDGNDRKFDVESLHRDADLLFSDGVDRGAAIPARGYRVKRHKDQPVHTYIERHHQGHLVHVWFEQNR